MKEGKVFKRILAIALVVVMTITMVPFSVFATGETATPETCTHETATYVARKAPNCTEDGHRDYYSCNNCNAKLLSNGKGGFNLLTGSVTESATGHSGGTATCNTKKVCTTCGASYGEFAAHAGGTATCTDKAVCDHCKQPYGDFAAHTETNVDAVAATCTTAGTTAGKKCSKCDAKISGMENIPALGHNWNKTTNCTRCNATHEHTGGTATCTKGKICDICEAEYTSVEHKTVIIPAVAPTCTEKGKTEGQKCETCGKVFIEQKDVAATGHDYSIIPEKAATCTEGGLSEGKLCKTCGHEVKQEAGSPLGHDYKENVILVEATCTKKGEKATVCSRCKDVKEGTKADVPMAAHSYKGKVEITKKPDCENKGREADICKVCGAEKTGTGKDINALGHQWDNGTVKVPADCTKDGVTTYKCKRTGCGKTEDRKVDKLEHEYKEEKVEATCEKDGYSVFTCQCGDEYIAKKVEKFGHSFITYVQDANTATCYADGTKTAECDHGCGKKNTIPDEGSKIDHKMTDFTTIKPATCTEEGEEEGKCFYFDKCGYSESYPTDALGHTVTKDTQFTVDKPATCTEKGSQSKHCERCDYTEGTEEIPALGHDFQPAEGTKATCTTGGYAKFKCSRCPETKEEANAEPLGHDFQYVSNNNATCKEDGTETGKCSRCDVVDTRTEAGSKLPHTLGEAVVVPATTEENGSITTKCTVCDEVVEAVEIAKISKLSLKYTVATYDGKTKHPKLTITDANGNVLVKGTDYTVEIPTKEESAKAGKHTYTVTFMGNYEGEEEVSYKVLPGKTSKISSEKKQTEIKLSWKAVKGATGYRVYVYNTKTKKYNIVAKYVKGKTSYTVKDLKANTSYKFAVKAYTKVDGELFWAEESTKVTVKTLVGKTSKITAAPAATSVKLSWKKVSGADGYRVYVYNAKTKSYKILEKNVTGTSYTVKGLKAGTSYKFAVKAYDTVSKKTVWSNQYTTVNVTTKR